MDTEKLPTPTRRPRPRAVRSIAPRPESWWVSKRPVIWFAARFLGAIVVFYALSLLPGYQAAQAAFLRATAWGAHAALQAGGVGCQLAGDTIWSTKYSVTVGPQCSAAELAWFLVAAMLAFPASWGHRLLGVAAGLSVLAVLNVVRVGSLYVVGVHAPAQFAWAHESGWPAVLVIATVAIMGVWIGRGRPSIASAYEVAC